VCLAEAGQRHGAFFHYPGPTGWHVIVRRNVLGWIGFSAINLETDRTCKSQ